MYQGLIQSLRFASHSVWLIHCKNFFDRIIVTGLDLVFFPKSRVNGLENERQWIHTVIKINENERYRSSKALLYIRKERFENQPKDFADVQDCCLQSGPVSDPFRFPLWLQCSTESLFPWNRFSILKNFGQVKTNAILSFQLELIQNRVLKDCDHWK